MIIYKRKKKQLVIPAGLGPVECQDAGYELQEKTADASIEPLVIVPDASYYGLAYVNLNPVTSSIDPDIIPENIRHGVNILGVTGVYAGGDLQQKTVKSERFRQDITADEGYAGLSSVTVNPYILDSKTVDSSTETQVVISDEDGLSSVTVNPYVLDSKTVSASTGEQIITSDVDGLSSVTINAAPLQSRRVDASIVELDIARTTSNYYGLNHVYINPVTASIDPNIQAENIKLGVEILGVTGEYPGGTLQSKTVNSSTASQNVTPDEGNYGLSSVTVNPYTLDSKTVNSSTETQVITSDEDGLSSVTINPYVLDSKSIDPSTVSQTVVSNVDGLSSVTVNAAQLQNRTVDASTVMLDIQRTSSDYYGLRHVYINPVTASIDPNIQAENIRLGVEILGITGEYPGGTLQSKTVNSSTTSQNVVPDEGNYGLSSVTVNPYTLDSKTVDSSTVLQTITSDEDGLSSVTVNPYVLDSKTVDPSTNQIIVNSSADGLSSVTVNAANLQSRTVDPSTVQVRHYPTAAGAIGLSSLAVRAVTSSIDSNIQAENIKDGVTILGVTGTFDGGPLQSKNIDSSTASQTVTPDSDYYGLSSVTVNPYVLDSKTVNSSTVLQTITSSVDGLSSVTINPYVLDLKTVDSSTNPQTVISNVDGLAGVVVMPYALDSKTVDSSTVSQTITSSEDGLSSVTVNPYTVESVTVSAATSEQIITPTNADAISSVTVNAAPLQNRTVDASIVQIQVSRSTSNYYGLRTVTINAVTSSIDQNIQAENIKQGVTILDVTGTLEEADYDSIYNALLEI